MRIQVLAAFAVTAMLGANTELLRNGGFESEGFSDKGWANGWNDNCLHWAKLSLTYSDDTETPRSGSHAQKMDCTEFRSGAVQMLNGTNINVVKGQRYRMSFWMKGTDGLSAEVRVFRTKAPYTVYLSKTVQVTDAWREYKHEETANDNDPNAMLVIRFTSKGLLFVDDISMTTVEGTGAEGIVLSPPKTAIPPQLFGMHIHGHWPSTSTEFPDIPFKAIRLWDSRTMWPYLEPTKGNWDFKKLDWYVEAARKHGAEVLLVLGLTPTWASSKPDEPSAYNKGVAKETGWAAPPKNIEDWKNYVRTVATRYKGVIRHYEIWNEVNHETFFSGTQDEIVMLNREAAAVLKEIDPANVMVASSTVGNTGFMRTLLEKGMARNANALGYHFYTWDKPEIMIRGAQEIDEARSALGVKLPVWNTEAGWRIESKEAVAFKKVLGTEKDTLFSYRAAGDFVARCYILTWALGIERYYYYSMDNNAMGLIEKDGTFKDTASAYASAAKWLVGSVMRSCARDKDGVWTVELARGERKAHIVWNADGDSSFALPAEWKASKTAGLYGDEHELTGASIMVGPSPVLIK
ncbi:MAG: carbohydrate binding domain-containing protein [Spirochaetota bacterium]